MVDFAIDDNLYRAAIITPCGNHKTALYGGPTAALRVQAQGSTGNLNGPRARFFVFGTV